MKIKPEISTLRTDLFQCCEINLFKMTDNKARTCEIEKLWFKIATAHGVRQMSQLNGIKSDSTESLL